MRNGHDIFGTNGVYIENIGQYGDTLSGYGYMGKIICAYEGFGMPVLFTKKGMIFLHREVKLKTFEEIRKEERRKKRKGEDPGEVMFRDKVVTMEWVNANVNQEWKFENESPVTYTFGLNKNKASAFQKLLVKNLYPGIDAEYSFKEGKQAGFEYKLFVQPGADPGLVKMKYGGDVVLVKKDEKGNLSIRSSIETITQTLPLAFLEEIKEENKLDVSFQTDKKTIGFKLSRNYDRTKLLIIDPFISTTSSLTGINTQKAKDIDFDYAGNVYVSGGGSSSAQMLAKYNSTGVLLWTFSGTLTTPAWQFGSSYGGWVIDKSTGAAYLGQGLTSGFIIVRLNTNGVYDNYITTANPSFTENWKMIYGCKAGIATILAAGGGGNANNELALIAPPALVPTVSNISGLTGGHNDISDIVLDPLTDDMYTIFSIPVTAVTSDNTIYKHAPPHDAGSKLWSVTTGLFAMKEPNNRPYLNSLDNSSNTLAINANYLFYWDGKNLKAFSKASGTALGTVLTTPSTLLQQGGIFADECNNVFTGSTGGVIKVYKFDGTSFNDNAAPDLTVTGFTGSVFDLAFDNGKRLLYASGNGFVASFDLSTYCPTQVYEVQVATSCASSTATATISPAPSSGTTISYVLYSGATQVATNSTGVFTGLVPGPYSITAFLNQACGGPQSSTNFVVPDGPTLVVNDPPAVCDPLTVDITNPAITTGSSSGITLSYWRDAAATVPFATPTSAASGTYYIKAITSSGCFKITAVHVNSRPSPVANAGTDKSICLKSDAQLQGSGGVSYEWSPATFLSDPFIANPIVLQPTAGTHRYQLTVTDIGGCKSAVPDWVTITVRRTAPLYLPSDTAIVVNQPLQLDPIDISGLGITNYVWTPSTGLSNPLIKNPIAIIDRNIIYTVDGSAGSCAATASIRVTVYKQADIFVPSAFTPDNNGLNDVLKAIPVGIKTFLYFRVYNRLGNLVFSTSDPRNGWNGKIEGVQQGSGVFVWTAEGIDYSGKKLFRKGTTSIIR